MHQGLLVDDPPASRLFIVCGRSVDEDTLRAAFQPYGLVQNVKVIREKGVAYVKFDKASSAALAMEELNGATLNNGRGSKIKVLLAEAPAPRGAQLTRPPSDDQQVSDDPDNNPPRSRLFLVVPKTADPRIVSEEASRFPDLEYCKTDLISAKGVVFFKYSKSSSALTALEDIAGKGMLGPYKVKCMLAEPKTKRNRLDALGMGLLAGQGKLDLGPHAAFALEQSAAAFRLAAANAQLSNLAFNAPPGSMPPSNSMLSQQAAAAAAAAAAGLGMGTMLDYSSLLASGSLPGLPGLPPGAAVDLASQFGLPNLNGLAPASTPDSSMGAALSSMSGLAHSSPGNGSMNSNTSTLSTVNFPVNFMGLGGGAGLPPAGPPSTSSPPLSKQRLFVVVHKTVTEDMLQRLFRQFPGMEYCDLKKDRTTGRSKGYCYVNYSTPIAAQAAVEQLNGIEFPPGTNYRIKVMFAEMLGSSSSSSGARRPPTRNSLTPLQLANTPGALTNAISSASASPSRSSLSQGVGRELGVVPEGYTAVLPGGMGDSSPNLAAAEAAAAAAAAYELGQGGSAGISQVTRELMFSVGA